MFTYCSFHRVSLCPAASTPCSPWWTCLDVQHFFSLTGVSLSLPCFKRHAHHENLVFMLNTFLSRVSLYPCNTCCVLHSPEEAQKGRHNLQEYRAEADPSDPQFAAAHANRRPHVSFSRDVQWVGDLKTSNHSMHAPAHPPPQPTKPIFRAKPSTLPQGTLSQMQQEESVFPPSAWSC